MEQHPSRLVSLTLVLKHHPILNYSYPRYEIFPRGDTRSSMDESFNRPERLAAAPISDNGPELGLWDSFWEPEVGAHIKKQYPTLAPLQRRKGGSSQRDCGRLSAGWLLPEAPKSKPSQLAASDSTLPNPINLPRGRCPALSWQKPEAWKSSQRPQRHSENLSPCIPQTTPIKAFTIPFTQTLDTIHE
ncbi:hypothetical protein V2G26_018277 [Clonostachys chloroleuca]